MRLLLTGPTAVGKTGISIRLARALDAEIISSDSRQCYRYMNIGTATPDEEEQGGIPHHNLSIIDPAQKDSAANFYRRSQQWESEIAARNRRVLYVGGSTLHQRCIIQPFDEIPDADEEHIARLEREMDEQGIEVLYQRLQEVDPEYAEAMDGMNTQRIIRALDVWMQTGRPFSSFHSDGPVTPASDLLVVGLRRDRPALYERINQRVETMFEAGFLDEVQGILERGYSLDDPGLNTVGYKEAIAHLAGQMDRETMIRTMKTQTRRYAKRQMTYFRRWDFVHWIDAGAADADAITEQILELREASGRQERGSNPNSG